MELIKGILVKQYEDNREHFIYRLKERYGIEISKIEYQLFCLQFKGKFKKNNNRTVGFVFIYGVKVWCLYMSKEKSLVTAYPPDIENDVEQLIKACISVPLRHLAYKLYENFVDEKKLIPDYFTSQKEAAKYLFGKTLFPDLHIDIYKYGNVDNWKVISIIDGILYSRSPYVDFKIIRKPEILIH